MNKVVLILVFVEVGLVAELSDLQQEQSEKVLILVFVEVSLVVLIELVAYNHSLKGS